MTTYKTCAVPMCGNTTVRCPDKLFIHVPQSLKRRKQWLKLARRDPKVTSNKSTIFFCEDHFDLPNDMENYIQYNIMGSVGKIRMKPNCLPTNFICQPDRRKRTAPSKPRSAVSKRRRMDIIQEVISKETEIPATSGMTTNSDLEQSATEKDCFKNVQDKAIQVCPEVSYKITQVCLKAKFRSKAIQTSSQAILKNTSPLKSNITSSSTSPLKITKSGAELTRCGDIKIKRNILFHNENLEVSSLSSSPSKTSQLNTDTSSSVRSLLILTSTGSDQETKAELYKIKRKIEEEHLYQMSIKNNVQLSIVLDIL